MGLAGSRQHRHRRKQQSQNPGHFHPRENIKTAENHQVETGHNRSSFASKQPVSATLSSGAVKKGNTPQTLQLSGDGCLVP
jgi:hypothetical protein